MKKKTKQPQSIKTSYNQWINKDDLVLKRFLAEIAKYPVIETKQLIELISKAQQGCEESRELAIKSNVKLVLRIAKNYQTPQIPLSDLIQEGILGLFNAVDKYDEKKKVPFPHFASWWIKTRIIRYSWNIQNIVHLPENLRNNTNKLKKITAYKQIAEGSIPTYEDFKKSGLSDRIIQKYLINLNIDSYLITDKLSDMSENDMPKEEALEDFYDKTQLALSVSQCLDTLSEEDCSLLKNYYGISTPQISAKELAKQEGVPVDTIHRKKNSIIKILKRNCTELLIPYRDNV